MRLLAVAAIAACVVSLICIAGIVPPAAANNVDFACNLALSTLCTGTASGSGSTWSTSGLGFYQDAGPQPANTLFTLTFNTGVNKQLTLTGPGAEVLQGTYSTFSATPGFTSTSLSFSGVAWTTLPSDFQTYLGSATGVDNSFAILAGTNCANGCPNQSGDILITPVPEPSSLSMFSLGLLLPGGGFALLRRRRRK